MHAVRLVCGINAAHSITAFEFAFTILHAGHGRVVTLTVVLSHVHIHVVLAPDYFATTCHCTLEGFIHTLNLRAVCFKFLILVSAFMSLQVFQG
jgi:hypothetical protein